jgi:hypothetical protein
LLKDKAFQPDPEFLHLTPIFALYGGSLDNSFMTKSSAFYTSNVGGILNERMSLSFGWTTLPAKEQLGKPSIPVTVQVGDQHLAK